MKPLIFLFCLLIGVVVHAQLERTGTPVSWNQELSIPVEGESVDEANIEFLLAEDATHVDDRSVPYRFAFAREVSWTMNNSGSWYNLANGDRLWILGIAYDGAHSIAVTLNQLHLPKGGKLYVYSEDHEDYLGPLTESENRSCEIGLPHIRGQKIYIEYYEPRLYRGEGSLSVGYVAGSYRNLQSEALPLQSCAQWLAGSVIGDEPSGSSVMRVLVDHGQRYATAVLVNNSSNSAEPLVFLPSSALMGSAASLVFQFGLNDQQCLEGFASCAAQIICGADVVCADVEVGLSLLRLKKAPLSDWDAYYTGWSVGPSVQNEYCCVQHPKGLSKSYSQYHEAFVPVVQDNSVFIGLEGEGQGQTYGGSLGSPLFDSDWNLVGLFIGGNSRCAMSGGFDRFVLLQDVWPTFRQFLDPLQSSSDRIPGMELPDAEIVIAERTLMRVFPNPAVDRIELMGGQDFAVYSIKMYDGMGRLLLSNIGQSSVDVSHLLEGVYTLAASTNSGVLSQTVLITKK